MTCPEWGGTQNCPMTPIDARDARDARTHSALLAVPTVDTLMCNDTQSGNVKKARSVTL